MTNSSYLADKIRSLRRQKKLSQEELAENSGLSVGAITRIETNVRTPKIETLVKIARALGVTTDELLQSRQEPAKISHTHDQRLDINAYASSAQVLEALSKLPRPHLDFALAWIFQDESFLDALPDLQEKRHTILKAL